MTSGAEVSNGGPVQHNKFEIWGGEPIGVSDEESIGGQEDKL